MKKHKVIPFVALIAFLIGGWLVFRAPTDERAPAIPDTGTATTTEQIAKEVSISISPDTVLQGDPALITIEGINSTSSIRNLTLSGKNIDVFIYDGKPRALVGYDLKAKSGSFPLVLTLADGTVVREDMVVGSRVITQAPLGIPDKLGGNTPQAEQQLISSLAEENAVLASVQTVRELLWAEPFAFPLESPVVTDPYGYTRLTGASTISHKGTDFRAAVGTPIYAMNSGVVRIARDFNTYGKTVVIDHGFGVQTLYMHLSELIVKSGDRVKRGQMVAKSGMTGYAEFPHLHISVKIGGVSIDPMKFLDLFRN